MTNNIGCKKPLSCSNYMVLLVVSSSAGPKFSRLLTNTGGQSHVSPELTSFHWLPVKDKFNFKVLFITYKALQMLQFGAKSSEQKTGKPSAS